MLDKCEPTRLIPNGAICLLKGRTQILRSGGPLPKLCAFVAIFLSFLKAPRFFGSFFGVRAGVFRLFLKTHLFFQKMSFPPCAN